MMGKKSAPEQKPLLAVVVRQKLKEKGVSQDDYANNNEVDHDNFRTQLARNTYSDYVLYSIAELLECELEKLHENYSFSKLPSPLAGAISPLEALRRKIRKSIRVNPDNQHIMPL